MHLSPPKNIPAIMLRSATALSKAYRDAAAVRRCGAATRSWRRSAAAIVPPRGQLRASSSSAAAGVVAVGSSRDHDGPSSLSRLACALAAASLAAAASFDAARAPAEAEAKHATHHESAHHDPDAEMRALGKSLQASHERQMVRMAKLLHSLETLAEEAEKEKMQSAEEAEKERRQSEQSSGGEGVVDDAAPTQDKEEEEGDRKVIYISDAELSSLPASPHLVWEHIVSLRDGAVYGREDVKRIARAAASVMRSEPSLVDLSKRCKKEEGGDLRTVTVVGDLHGHFECSLLKILDMLGGMGEDGHGSPWNGTGAVVFNGDFVDRGHNSIEVLVSLLLLKLAYPNNVYLNRGNHEDAVIAEVYGCKDELQARYEGVQKHGDQGVQDIWKEFEEVFASLPLAVLTDSAIIMHGGLPSADFRLEQIAQIPSEERSRIKTMVEPAANDETCKLVQNVMWSDPQPELGMSPNEDRGCGMRYGPDVVRSFLSNNDLKYLIRSHEPVDEGYELLECDENGMSAVTVFSAASYPGGAGFNYGAIVRLRDGDATFDAYGENEADNSNTLTMKEKMSHTFKAFAEVIAANRTALEEEFEYMASKRARRRRMQRQFSLSEGGSISQRMNPVATSPAPVVAGGPDDANCITPESWADVMSFVLNEELPNVDWLSIQKFIAPGDLINYKRFLNLQCTLSSSSNAQASGMDDHTRHQILRNHEAIIKVFEFLDEDGSGEVDREEFCNGIGELKKRNPEAVVSFDPEALFDSIDADGSGSIELSEFHQAFQAVDVPYHVAVMMSLDADNSGTIDRLEFRDGVRLLNARLNESEKIPESDDEINRIFDELDDDGSGELDAAEFEKFVSEYYPH